METKEKIESVFNLSDERIKHFDNEKFKIWKEHKDTEEYKLTAKVIDKLGLGGLWRGHDLCFLIVFEAIKNKKMYGEL